MVAGPEGRLLRQEPDGALVDHADLRGLGAGLNEIVSESFACTLGGEDGRTLFMLAPDWRLQDGFEDNIQRLTTGPETGQVLTTHAPAAHAGHP